MIYITGDMHGDTEKLSKTELSMLAAKNYNFNYFFCCPYKYFYVKCFCCLY